MEFERVAGGLRACAPVPVAFSHSVYVLNVLDVMYTSHVSGCYSG